MFNKFIASKQSALGGGARERRPHLASSCRDLDAADKWRQEILREIGKKVMEIQNAGLGEHRLRDLNDEINKLIREKSHWERQILALGGPNYAAQGRKEAGEAEGGVSAGDGKPGGYRYFGAAKSLPGVREVLEKPSVRTVRRTRKQMRQRIDADYYGFRDEEDGVLLKLEAEAEAKMRAKAVAEWEAARDAREAADGGKRKRGDDEADAGAGFAAAHVPLPEEKEIEKMVLAKKKADLLAKYASAELDQQQAETKAMRGE